MQNQTEKKNRLGQGLLHLSGAKLITMLITLVSGMLLARFRTVSEYGTYSQLSIVVTLAVSLFTLGLPESSNYFLARAESGEERKKFLSVFYSLNTLLCLIMGLVLVLLVPIIEAYFNNNTIRYFAYFLALYPWAKVTISTISNVLVVYGKTQKLMLINVLTSFVALVSLLLIKVLGLSFQDYVLSFFAGHIIIAIWIYGIVSRLENGLRVWLDKELIKEILAYSIPIGLAALVSTINVEIDKLMIGGLMDTESLAYYTTAGKELPLTIVASSLTTILMPIMARKIKKGEYQESVRLWGSAVQLSFIIMCFFSTMCIAYAPQIMTILYSTKYLPGVNVFRIYALVLLLRTTYWGMLLSALGRTKIIFRASVFSLILNCILNYSFYRLFGFPGPAVASVVSITLVSVFQLLQTSRYTGIPFREIMPWKQLLSIFIVNMVWGVLSIGSMSILRIQTSNLDIIKAIVIGFVFFCLYGFFFMKKIKTLWKALNCEKNEIAA